MADATPPPTSTASGLGPWCVGVRVVVRRRLPGSGPTGGPNLTDLLGILEGWGDSTVTVRPEEGPAVVIARADIVAGKPVPPRPSTRLRVSIEDAERRAIDSWPPLEREELGGWVLRASRGFSARANSALVLGTPEMPRDDAVAAVRDFYAARGLPAWVQTMTGSAEQRRLQGAGWETARPGEADTGFHLAGVAAARRAAARLLPAEPVAVQVTGQVTPGWLADDARAREHGATAVAVLEAPAEVGFGTVAAPSGAVVAKGRAALSERSDVWVGLTDIWVHPEARRRGLAAAVVHGLLGWAAERGATTAYLQVREDNAAGLGLYERLGFLHHHSYRYLTAR